MDKLQCKSQNKSLTDVDYNTNTDITVQQDITGLLNSINHKKKMLDIYHKANIYNEIWIALYKSAVRSASLLDPQFEFELVEHTEVSTYSYSQANSASRNVSIFFKEIQRESPSFANKSPREVSPLAINDKEASSKEPAFSALFDIHRQKSSDEFSDDSEPESFSSENHQLRKEDFLHELTFLLNAEAFYEKLFQGCHECGSTLDLDMAEALTAYVKSIALLENAELSEYAVTRLWMLKNYIYDLARLNPEIILQNLADNQSFKGLFSISNELGYTGNMDSLDYVTARCSFIYNSIEIFVKSITPSDCPLEVLDNISPCSELRTFCCHFISEQILLFMINRLIKKISSNIVILLDPGKYPDNFINNQLYRQSIELLTTSCSELMDFFSSKQYTQQRIESIQIHHSELDMLKGNLKNTVLGMTNLISASNSCFEKIITCIKQIRECQALTITICNCIYKGAMRSIDFDKLQHFAPKFNASAAAYKAKHKTRICF